VKSNSRKTNLIYLPGKKQPVGQSQMQQGTDHQNKSEESFLSFMMENGPPEPTARETAG
jgi:hypothetical protein